MNPTSEQPNMKNTTGAVIFLSYILAALVLTGTLLHRLIQQYLHLPAKRLRMFETRLQIFVTLSVLSFSALSYNMLHFLVVRYQVWRELNSIRTLRLFP